MLTLGGTTVLGYGFRSLDFRVRILIQGTLGVGIVGFRFKLHEFGIQGRQHCTMHVANRVWFRVSCFVGDSWAGSAFNFRPAVSGKGAIFVR